MADTPTVGGTLRGVVEAVHKPVTLTARTIPCLAPMNAEYAEALDALNRVREAAIEATIQSFRLPAAFIGPPVSEPPPLDLSADGGDLGRCAERMRAVIAGRQARPLVVSREWVEDAVLPPDLFAADIRRHFTPEVADAILGADDADAPAVVDARGEGR